MAFQEAFQKDAFQFGAFQSARSRGGGYPTKEELEKFVADEIRYQEEKTRQREKRIRENAELHDTVEIALLKAKGLWVEPQPQAEVMLPPELAQIPSKPFDPRLIGQLTNARSPDEDDIEVLLLAA